MTTTNTTERALPIEEITNDMAFSPDGTLLAIATRDKKSSTLIYSTEDWSLRPAPRFVRYALAFDGRGALVVASASVERFTLSAPKIGKSEFSIPGHKRGITHIAVSADGRWLAVSKYLDTLELWFVGDATPTKCQVFSSISLGTFFFRADSAGFWFTRHEYVAGSAVETLHRVALTAKGAHEAPTISPLPEGLSFHDTVAPSVHGLVTVRFPTRDVEIYDWDSQRPRALGVKSLQEQPFRCNFALSPDGGFLVAQIRHPLDARRDEYQLLVVSLPGGEEVATFSIGEVGAGRIAVSPGAEHIAFTRVDTAREVRVFKRAPRP